MRRAPSMGRSRAFTCELAFAALLLGLGVAAASAAVIAVPADQATIQGAVDAATAGDVVRVSPGIYAERVRISGARNGLTIEAADPAHPPVVQGRPNTSTDGIQVEGVAGVTLRELRIVSANTGVRLTRAANALLEGLLFVNDGLAIRVVNGSATTIRGVIVERTRGRQGILVESSPVTTIEDTVVHMPRREGIALRNSPGAVVVRTTVDGSQGGDGLLIYRSNASHVENVVLTNNARNGLRASSSLDLVLVRATANDNGSAGFRIERSSPFDEVADVLAAGNTAAGNRGQDIVVVPFRCNQSACPTTTSFTTSTTSSTTSSTAPTTPTTVVPPSSTTTLILPPPSTTTSTTTLPAPPLAGASWRFYVRIATGEAFPHNVDVPARSIDAPLDVLIAADQLTAFRVGDQVTGTEITALGGDTLDRLTAAVDAYLRAHPADYPGFQSIVELRWAKRVAPSS